MASSRSSHRLIPKYRPIPSCNRFAFTLVVYSQLCNASELIGYVQWTAIRRTHHEPTRKKVQYTAKAHTTGGFGPLWRLLGVLFAATVSLAPTATVLGQQPAQIAAQAQGAATARAAEANAVRRFRSVTTMIQKETAMNQLNTVQLDAAPDTATTAVRPFRINIPEAALVDLCRRVLATRWPDRETVTDQSQGVQLAKIQELVRYWGTDYDWRKAEAKLTECLAAVSTTIDGVDI